MTPARYAVRRAGGRQADKQAGILAIEWRGRDGCMQAARYAVRRAGGRQADKEADKEADS